MSDMYKWLHKVPGVLTFILVIALGITLANLLWMIVTPAPSVAQAANRASTNQVASLARQENYGKLIADQHLFGAIPKAAPTKIKKPKPVKAKPVKAPVNLNIKLHGIISSKSGDGGFAMISYNGKTQEVFSPGDPIPKKLPGQDTVESIGVMVTKIAKESVTIDNNGTEQLLTLPKPAAGKSSGSNNRRSASRPSAAASARIVQPTTSAPAAKPTLNSSGGIQTLTALREEALVNPNVLMTVITPSIVRENGQMTGIRVYPSRNRKLFRALGLRNGDVVTQVNGVVIDDQSKGMAIFQQLAESPSLEIHIKRGGNEQVLTPQF
ncbi:MAG: type II secretion system protein N [Leucothrix sp.]